jgi:hypothetical protein
MERTKVCVGGVKGYPSSLSSGKPVQHVWILSRPSVEAAGSRRVMMSGSFASRSVEAITASAMRLRRSSTPSWVPLLCDTAFWLVLSAGVSDFAKGVIRWGWAKVDGAGLVEVSGGKAGNVEAGVITGDGVLW